MKKVLFCFIMLLFSMVIFTSFVAALPTEQEVYVRSNANGSGTADHPVGTLLDAVNALHGEGGRVVLLNTVTVSKDVTLPEQSGDLTIVAAEGGRLALAADLFFAKNTNENVITLDCPIVVSGRSAAIFGGFNTIVFGENTVVSGSLDFYGGNDSANNATFSMVNSPADLAKNRDVITELPYSITVNAGTFRNFAGGSRRASRTSIIGSVAGDLTVTINGGTFGTGVTFAADSSIKMEQAFSLSGMSILAANATLTVNGGTFNVPVYAQGHMGEMSTNASGGSQVTKTDRKYYAIDGDIVMDLNGGIFNGCEISAFQNSSMYTQVIRGDFTLNIADACALAAGMTLDATQVKPYAGETNVASVTLPANADVKIKRFDYVNGKAETYEEPIRIVCLGDSITQGHGTTATSETESYPAQLLVYLNGEGAAHVDGREVLLGNYGCSGTRVLPYGNMDYTDMLAYPISVEETDPDYVIIGLGTNDQGHLRVGKGQLERFRSLYTDLLSAYGTIPGVQQVYGTTATYRANSVENGGGVNAAAYGAVTARGVQKEVIAALSAGSDKYTCIDLYALTLEDALSGKLLSDDNLHPATSGYRIYMETLVDAIFNGKCTVEDFELTDLYISNSGTNNAICSKEFPTNNMSIAFAKAAPNATIHVVDAYTCDTGANLYCLILPAVDSLKIVGEGSGATLTTNSKFFMAQSDLVLENLTLTTTADNAFMFQLGYNNVTLAESFSIPAKNYPMFIAGYISFKGKSTDTYYNTPESISSDKDCEINVLGGTYYYFMGGNYCYQDGCPLGTYSGNMTLRIGKNAQIVSAVRSSVINGISGMNYLTGTVTAYVDSWVADPIPEYATRGAAQASIFDTAKNTGKVTVILGEGLENDIVVMGDFDGDNAVTIGDSLLMLKYYLNNNFDQQTSFFEKETVSLYDVVASLKKLIM